MSLWNFYAKNVSLEAILEGSLGFGTWSDHVQSWNPWDRPSTLLLKYEDMVKNLPKTLKNISDFLKRDIIKESIPDRNTIAGIDGRFVKIKTDWQLQISDDQLKRFNEKNYIALKKAGYLD